MRKRLSIAILVMFILVICASKCSRQRQYDSKAAIPIKWRLRPIHARRLDFTTWNENGPGSRSGQDAGIR